jgi:ribosomal protein S18 acetylase RimI-like enzyme
MTRVQELQVLTPEMAHAGALASFFDLLKSAGDERFFHPHELTKAGAQEICRYSGKDYYCLMLSNDEVVAYGMLRGWDEGYDVPSLGIAVSPGFRGIGAGKAMLEFLHLVARLRKCSEVMLKVDRENHKAFELYRAFGYRFQEAPGDILLGRIRF